jgi:hypothetical protein
MTLPGHAAGQVVGHYTAPAPSAPSSILGGPGLAIAERPLRSAALRDQPARAAKGESSPLKNAGWGGVPNDVHVDHHRSSDHLFPANRLEPLQLVHGPV